MRKIIAVFFTSFFIFSTPSLALNELDDNFTSLKLISDKNAWSIKYDNFKQYLALKNKLKELNAKLDDPKFDKEKKAHLLTEIDSLEEQITLLAEYQDFSLSKELSHAKNLEPLAKITNPLAIVSGISHIKNLNAQKDESNTHFEEFKALVKNLKDQSEELERLAKLDQSEEKLMLAKEAKLKLDDFKEALSVYGASHAIFEKTINDEISRVKVEIKTQTIRTINILVAIVIVIIISFLLKILAKKYISDNNKFYIINKIINFTNLNIILLILLFAYIDNISYFITILGFASAGLAIAMKDMFMSMLGWCVIIFGGSLKVGDRIKVWQNNSVYVGDIIDISFLRLTIYEDITMTTYLNNRRSGRIIFIPNNYIFTDLIANYTHHGVKTVWDGLDITLSFDSNHSKALAIVEQIVIKHSKNFTDQAKKSMNKLRNEYSIKNVKVEPRFYMFFESYGMRISAWYMTSSYAALALRSTLSKEIVAELNKHEDIKIAYPSQNLYFEKKSNPIKEEEEGTLF